MDDDSEAKTSQSKRGKNLENQKGGNRRGKNVQEDAVVNNTDYNLKGMQTKGQAGKRRVREVDQDSEDVDLQVAKGKAKKVKPMSIRDEIMATLAGMKDGGDEATKAAAKQLLKAMEEAPSAVEFVITCFG